MKRQFPGLHAEPIRQERSTLLRASLGIRKTFVLGFDPS